MSDRNGFLVVGGDSLVGGGLVRALEEREHAVFASTRRANTVSGNRVLVDFEKEDTYLAPDEVGYAYIVAAATNYERCETDPMAKVINEELTPRLIESYLEQGLHVTFISTNSVFGGERPWPHEDDPHEPGIPYAKQKDVAEKNVMDAVKRHDAAARLNIVRLTKILDMDTPPLPTWFETWDQGKVVTPFSDLLFAPMSVRFVGNALATIGEKRLSGNLHLSGSENVSYVDLANSLAEELGIDKSLIEPTTSVEKGVRIAFNPTYSGLGMTRTTELSGVSPQTLSEVVSDVAAQLREKANS